MCWVASNPGVASPGVLVSLISNEIVNFIKLLWYLFVSKEDNYLNLIQTKYIQMHMSCEGDTYWHILYFCSGFVALLATSILFQRRASSRRSCASDLVRRRTDGRTRVKMIALYLGYLIDQQAVHYSHLVILLTLNDKMYLWTWSFAQTSAFYRNHDTSYIFGLFILFKCWTDDISLVYCFYI